MSLLNSRFGDAIYAFYRNADRLSDTAIRHFDDLGAEACAVPQAERDRAVTFYKDVCAIPLYAQIEAERAVAAAGEGELRAAVLAANKVFEATVQIVESAAEIAHIRARILCTDQALADADTAETEADRHCEAIEAFVAAVRGSTQPQPQPQP